MDEKYQDQINRAIENGYKLLDNFSYTSNFRTTLLSHPEELNFRVYSHFDGYGRMLELLELGEARELFEANTIDAITRTSRSMVSQFMQSSDSI